MLLQQAFHLAHHHLLDPGRELHRLELILDPQLQARMLLVEVGFVPRTGLGAQRFFRLLQLLAQFGQLLGKTQQTLTLGFVSLRTFLFIRLGFFVFLKDVAQIGLCGLDLLADSDDVVEQDGRIEDLFLDFLFPRFESAWRPLLPPPASVAESFPSLSDTGGPGRRTRRSHRRSLPRALPWDQLRPPPRVPSPGTSSRTLMSMPSKLSSAALRSPAEATSCGRKSFTWSKVR